MARKVRRTREATSGVCTFDARWIGPHGIGRFASELYCRLGPVSSISLCGSPSSPIEPLRLTRYLKRFTPDLYFTPGYNCPIGKPCRFTFCLHDLTHLYVPEVSDVAKRLYYALVVRPAIHNSEAVITVSEFSKAAICDWAQVEEDKVINVGNGVSDNFRPAGPEKSFGSKPYLLHVGSDRPHKNLKRTLRAFAESGLWREFDFVSTASPSAELANLANSNPLHGHVRFLDQVEESELPALYRGAFGLVFVSVYEGFGLPIVEAMACGTPVVTSSVTSMPEVAGDAAILVDPYDVDAIKGGLLRLASDTQFRQSLRIRGIERAKLYSWGATAQRVKSVIYQV